MKKHIKWKTLPTIRVNLETGEVITKYQASKMLKIKSEKHGNTRPINASRPDDGYTGEIQWTIGYITNPQGRIF